VSDAAGRKRRSAAHILASLFFSFLKATKIKRQQWTEEPFPFETEVISSSLSDAVTCMHEHLLFYPFRASSYTSGLPIENRAQPGD
jgi:hypothetical protein